MIKNIPVLCVAIGACINLSACAPEHRTVGATLGGAAVGGLLGAAVFSGPNASVGILGSALVGGIVGSQIGQYMDRQDAAQAHAIYISRSGRGRWTNQQSGYTYSIKPIRTYKTQGIYCREYRTKAQIGSRSREVYGTACRLPNGSWRVVDS